VARGKRKLREDSSPTRKKKRQRAHAPETLGSRVFRKGTWYHADLRWRGGGRPVLRDPDAPGWPNDGAKTDDLQTAVEWAAEYDRRWKLERIKDAERRTGEYRSLSRAVDAFILHREAQTAESTVAGSRTATTHLLEYLDGDVDPATVTTKELLNWCDKFLAAGYKRNTVRGMLFHIRALFMYLEIEPNPAVAVKLPEPVKRDVETWDEAQLAKIREAADALDAELDDGRRLHRRLVEFLLCTGARLQEAAAARWEEFDKDSGTIRIKEQLARTTNQTKPTKGKESRFVAVHAEWWPWHDPNGKGLIFTTEDGSAIRYRPLYDVVRNILERAELKKPGEAAHQFRHTYSSMFLERGGSIYHLSKSLGHKRVSTTEKYYDHLNGDQVAKAAVEQMYGGGKKTIRRGPRKTT